MGYYRRVRREIYALQMREAVVRLSHQGVPIPEIARRLGQTPPTIKRYKRLAMERAIARAHEPLPDADPPPYARRGEVLDPPERVRLRQEVLKLRKAMLSFEEIAVKTGLTVNQASAYVAEALREIERSEVTHAELERRLMVEQIDDMIRAVRPQAVRRDKLGPALDAVDRMLKLMDRKAKLLGLDQLPTQDIMVKLQEIATDGGYDLLEIEDIARDVLARHRFKLPPRVFTPDQVPIIPDEEPAPP